MLVWVFAAFGALLGALSARRRGGNRLDILQYAAGFGIAFFLIGLVVWIVYIRAIA